MLFSYKPQNVIFNFNSPNENDCINEQCESTADVYEEPSFSSFMFNRSRWRSPSDLRSSFMRLQTTENQPGQLFNSREIRRRLRSFPSRATEDTTSNEINEEAITTLKSLIGSSLLCRELRRVGENLEGKIGIHFPRTTTKAMMLRWYSKNWDQIKGVINDAANPQA